MTTLLDGTVVDESINALNYTPAALCPSVFGYHRTISSITIHHWGNLGQNFDDVVGYLASANPRLSSAHAIIAARRAASIVNPNDAAWHGGNAYGTATSIGLECRPEATDEDYITVAAYIAFLRSAYGDLPLIPHNYWTATACPGKWDLARLDRMAVETAKQGIITAQGEIDMATAYDPGREWYQAMIQAQARIDQAVSTMAQIYKSTEKADIYRLEGGYLRGISYTEWKLLGSPNPVIVPQEELDKMPQLPVVKSV